jgi:hypothetical protein
MYAGLAHEIAFAVAPKASAETLRLFEYLGFPFHILKAAVFGP